ncbi:MAG: GTPase [Planctomycetota bacterium]
MPANLTHQYHAAEQRFKEATTDPERIQALEEMIRELPKHKGTEKIYAGLKKKLSDLKNASQQSGATTRVDPFHVERAGGGQVMLVGLPNTGKSALVAATTNAPVEVADYPFSTPMPVPGMIYFEDAPIQVIDTPPMTDDYVPTGMVNALRQSDLILVVADAHDGDVLEMVQVPLELLDSKTIVADDPEDAPPLTKTRDKVVLVLTHMDVDGAADSAAAIRELVADKYTILEVSCQTGAGLDELRKLLFDRLEIIRIYTQKPGHDPDYDKPFLLRRGQTVTELARKVHRDLPEHLKSARVWGSAKFDGQPVKHDHVLQDKDVVELHE